MLGKGTVFIPIDVKFVNSVLLNEGVPYIRSYQVKSILVNYIQLSILCIILPHFVRLFYLSLFDQSYYASYILSSFVYFS